MQSLWFLKALVFLSLIADIASFQYAPLEDEGRLRFTIVDVSIYMLSLPAIMNSQRIDNFSMACQVFLESTLNVQPTTIIDLQVAIPGQSIDGRQEISGNSTNFVLETQMHILIKYLLDYDNVKLNDMDERVRTLLSEEWDELVALLKLLDSSFFGSLNTIELKPRLLESPDSTIVANGKRPQKKSNAPPVSVIIIFLVVGIGVFISLLTMAPICLTKSKRRRTQTSQQTRATTTGSPETGPGGDPQSSKLVGISQSRSSGVELPTDSRGYIQRLYSDDKLKPTLSGLKVQKVHAEDKLKQSLSGFKRSLEGSGKSGANYEYTYGIPRVSTPSTDNASDLESQPMGPSAKQGERKRDTPRTRYAREKYVYSTEQALKAGFEPFWITPSNKSDRDDSSSLSSMTSGGVWTDDEDEELEVLSENHGGKLPVARRSRKPGIVHPSLTTEEFGSIAPSQPSSDRTSPP